MTQQEFEEKIEAIEATIKKAKEEIKAIKQQYRDENMPYPIGTKVKVTDFHGETEYGIVMGAEINLANKVIPVVMKVKKDGTPYKTSRIWIQYDSKVEEVNE